MSDPADRAAGFSAPSAPPGCLYGRPLPPTLRVSWIREAKANRSWISGQLPDTTEFDRISQSIVRTQPPPETESRWVQWFLELDAWTEYWDIYHPETRGRFYFGDGSEEGLLTRFLPRERRPPAFLAWCRMATGAGHRNEFLREVRGPDVAPAVMEVDALVSRLFEQHFGDPSEPAVQADYLDSMFRFGADLLPPAPERLARIPDDDPRKRTAGRHEIDGDIMWFAWALALEAAYAIARTDREHPRRALQLAGVAVGCPANLAWRGHRYTRPEYAPDESTAAVLLKRGRRWAGDFDAAASEIHALYRIREWGHE